jgi:hypothetical protein
VCVCVGLGDQSITEFVVSLKTLFLLNEKRVERRRLKKKFCTSNMLAEWITHYHLPT